MQICAILLATCWSFVTLLRDKSENKKAAFKSLWKIQCYGSGSVGSVWFWASLIRIWILLLPGKKSKKNLYSYCFVTLFDLVKVKVISRKTFFKVSFLLDLEGQWRKKQDLDQNPLVRSMNPRIQIHTKISWIRNTGKIQVSSGHHGVTVPLKEWPEVDDEVEVNAEVGLQPVVPAAQHRQLSRAQATLFPVRKCSFYVNFLNTERLFLNNEKNERCMKYQFRSFVLSTDKNRFFRIKPNGNSNTVETTSK